MRNTILSKGLSSRNKSNAEEYLRQGVKAKEKCNLREALALFEKAAKDDPNCLRVWKYKAELLDAFGKHKEAEKCYERIIDYCHKDFKTLTDNVTLYSLAILEITKKEKEKELKIVDELLEKHPRSTQLWLTKLDIISCLHGKDKALELADKLLQHFPRSYKVWDEKRLLLHLSEKYDELFEHLDKQLKKFPNETETILLNKAFQLKSLGRLDEALACYEKLIKRRRDGEDSLQEKAEILVETKKYKEAIKTLDKLLEIKYKIGDITYSLLSRWIPEIRPDYLNIWLLKARAFKGLKRYREAVECYEIVDRMSGDAYEAYISAIKGKRECSRKLAIKRKKVGVKKNG